MKFYVKKQTQKNLQTVVDKFGKLMTVKNSKEFSDEQAAIVILFNVIKEMDRATTRMINLAEMAIKDSSRVEEAILNSKDGREFIEHMEFIRPDVFENLTNARVFWDA